ncbi:MAG: hypothetical protein ACYC7D_10625 [Nitrososphaerales archaeon]
MIPELIAANIACALVISTSDMVSTWWFMSPLKKLGMEPSRFESGLTARWLVRSLGIRAGLIANGLVELFSMVALLSAVVFASPYFLKGIDPLLSTLFWNSLALTYFALIVHNNYEFGKRSRMSFKV